MAAVRPLGWSWAPVPFPSLNGTGRAHKSLAGENLPESMEDIFSDESIQIAVMEIDRIKRQIEKARQSWNPHIAPRIADLLEEASALMAGSIPWSLCPQCSAMPFEDGQVCPDCMGSGWQPLAMRGAR